MRHRVTLQARSQERDTSGQVKQTYTDRLNVWASVEPLRGREIFGGEKFSNEITTIIKIRFQKGVDESWRVKRLSESMGTEFYGILSIVRPYAIKREMWLGCKQMPMGEPV